MTSSPRRRLPIERLDYDLPPELIAQEPIEPRDASRLLVVHRDSGLLEDRTFRDLPDLLEPGDLLILNDTRVLKARLRARRSTGGLVELLLLSQFDDGTWSALARPARRLRAGDRLTAVADDSTYAPDGITIIGRDDDTLRIALHDPLIVEQFGRVPLPPYIRSALDDPERYQTVYARASGSAAAPTAGLHFTAELLERCNRRGIELQTVTLHVGLDTFQPIKADDALEHPMHAEWFHVSRQTMSAVSRAQRDGRRVIAVGTTCVRTLETLAAKPITASCEQSGWTKLYITPGYRFQIVDGMVTNFHLPRTTLLLLVSALAGEDCIRQAYQHAIQERYRFYSFGDAMLIV